MKLRTYAVVMMILIVSMVTFAQNQEPPAKSAETKTFKANETQLLKLENLQLKAKLAQQPVQQAQQLFQQSLQAIYAEAAIVIKENKWPEGTTLNLDTLEFTFTPPKPAVTAPPAAKPEVKK